MRHANALVDVDKLGSGALLDYVSDQLQANNPIDTSNPDGLIDALGYRRYGEQVDAVGPFSPGTDRVADLHIPATLAGKQPMARKKSATDAPGTLHMLVEHDQRFRASTGEYSLQNLSRLAVAMGCLVAEQAGTQLALTVATTGQEPILLNGDDLSDSVWAMSRYDAFVAEPRPTVINNGEPSALASGLQTWAEEDFGLDDVALVVSDFVDGAVRLEDGSLQAFDWEDGLAQASRLEDRLWVARLSTPAQTQLVRSAHMAHGGRRHAVDGGNYQKLAAAYAKRGQAKATRITSCLAQLRQITLQSTDKTPVISLGDFMFGSPAQY